MKAGVLENVDCFCQIDCFEINDEIEIGRGSQVTVKDDCHPANDEVARIGGWREYAKQAQQVENTPSKAAGDSKPKATP